MSAEPRDPADSAAVYRDGMEHIEEELRWLDMLITHRVATFRESLKALERSATGQQMYISHGEVDWLLGVDTDAIESAAQSSMFAAAEALRRKLDSRVARSLERGVALTLPHLARMFHLSPIERQAMVVCLAPELDPKYDKIFAYLHDDVTRKRPSVRLVLELLCPTRADRWNARPLFGDHGALLRTGLLQTVDDPASPSGSSDLARALRLDPAILNFILGLNVVDPRFEHALRLVPAGAQANGLAADPELQDRLRALMRREFSENPERGRLVVNLHGPHQTEARELVFGTCRPLQRQVLCVDLEALLSGQQDPEHSLRLAMRESLLLQAPVLVENLDALLDNDSRHKALARRLAGDIARYCQLAFLVSAKPWYAGSLFQGLTFQHVRLPAPSVSMRESAWRRELGTSEAGEAGWPALLARHLQLTSAQIGDVVHSARNECAMAERAMSLADLFAACRRQSNHALGDLALKIEPAYSWEHLVLPADKCERLRELCAQVRHYHQVFEEWGFGTRLSHGKGLSALFSGPPGTGKTMAAEVVARELGLELYKVDLSGVVSKYIGETEKNLSRIFREAAAGNAILFFDEADALFGKRTEVSDAHDRYANIETSYLLQKMEEYEGVAILASNLRENMDQAFVRRLRFIIEFPFPDEASRLRIWRTHFPESAPVSDDLDYGFLARQFQIAGGNIKNVVLNAAFLAADDGGAIGMSHVLQSAKREFEKIGKRWDDAPLARRVQAAA
ncbi:MAG TPA: ATP-binding protein [Burkholderiales bacterium]|nr:ATP-binding protein [Burkholderiales bacterium]